MAAALDPHGWWSGARRYDSPNYNARPPGSPIDLLVLHNISLPAGEFGGPHIADLFTNRCDFAAHPSFADLQGLEVSSHFLVRRDGAVTQFVACEARAWHAGTSHFDGRDNCNDFSIGIEIEGSDHVAFSPAQYDALATLIPVLLLRYPISAIVGHEHVAPGRKTDPGPHFDWRFLRKKLAAASPPEWSAYQTQAVVERLLKVKWP